MRKALQGKIVIGIDQSYHDTGISVVYNNKLKYAGHCYLGQYKNNTRRREVLKERLARIFTKVFEYECRYNATVTVIIERIRLRSNGALSLDYIKSVGALNALICDLARIYNFPVYSVDTRAWKGAVVGTAKPEKNDYGIDPKKWPTVQWCVRSGYKRRILNYEVSPRKVKGIFTDDAGKRYVYNDNIADSIAIAFYGFVEKQNLKEEH